MVPRSRALGAVKVLLALCLRIPANATSASPYTIKPKNTDCHWEQCHCQNVRAERDFTIPTGFLCSPTLPANGLQGHHGTACFCAWKSWIKY